MIIILSWILNDINDININDHYIPTISMIIIHH